MEYRSNWITEPPWGGGLRRLSHSPLGGYGPAYVYESTWPNSNVTVKLPYVYRNIGRFECFTFDSCELSPFRSLFCYSERGRHISIQIIWLLTNGHRKLYWPPHPFRSLVGRSKLSWFSHLNSNINKFPSRKIMNTLCNLYLHSEWQLIAIHNI